MDWSIHPENRFLYAPTEPAAAAAPAAPAIAPETPAASTTPAATTPATTPAAASAPATTATPAVGTTTAPVTPAASPASWLDSFRKEGFNADNEDAARAQLLQSHRDAERLRPLAPALSAYQQHAGEFQKWLADKQKASAAPVADDWTKKLGWNHPEYNAAWKHQIVTDANGNMTPAPGAPADVVLKYQQAQSYRQEFIEKFLNNPGEALKPFMQHIAQEQAQQYAQQNVGQYREQQEATSFIDKHQSWLFDQDKGAPKTVQQLNPQTGRYESQKVLSKYGQAFVQHLQQGQQAGLSTEMQQSYALQAVQNAYMASPEYADYLIQQRATAAPAAAAAPVDPRAAANAAFVAKANPAAPPTKGSAGNSTPAPVQVNRNNLEQVMLDRFRAEGVVIT